MRSACIVLTADFIDFGKKTHAEWRTKIWQSEVPLVIDVAGLGSASMATSE